MKAIAITVPGEADVLQMKRFPDPEPRPGELSVQVKAAGINRADLLQRRGLYPPPAGVEPSIPGLEVAGIVERSEDPRGRFKPGDRIMALVGGAGYAERIAVPATHCLKIPERLSFAEAAAIPEVFLTAYDALFRQIKISVGESLLIHAVGSGVGTAALQLALVAGIRVVGTSRNSAKIERARQFGLTQGVTTDQPEWPSRVRSATAPEGVNAIVDLVGAAFWKENLDLLAPLGRMIVVGLVSGSRVEADLSTLLRKRLRILGTALRSRTDEEKGELITEFGARCLPLFDSGALRPVVDRVFPWNNVIEAHHYLEGNQNFGKLILSVE